jgi:hypothetical protein
MVRAGVAGKERKDMLDRAYGAKEEKRKKGELAQSKIVLPFGVDYEKGVWSYKPVAATKVRQAYRQVLSGKINYASIAKQLGVTPRGAAMILRNPIWKGWRVLDKKRDTSSNGRYTSPNGRQSDRRKIARAEAEIIKVKVIAKPLLSEADWARAQQIMDRKSQLHWREGRRRGTNPARFTYAGFLRCAVCGEPVHSVKAKRDYYVCKGRRTAHACPTPYMDRERLEQAIDNLLAADLTRPAFLRRCVAQLRREAKARAGAIDADQLTAAMVRLTAKRARILDAYLEGVLKPEDRDARLAAVDGDLETTRAQIAEMEAAAPLSLTPELLTETLSVLGEWRAWTYDQKRRVLGVLAPEIRVANGSATTIGLTLGSSVAYTRSPAASATTAPANASAPHQ